MVPVRDQKVSWCIPSERALIFARKYYQRMP